MYYSSQGLPKMILNTLKKIVCFSLNCYARVIFSKQIIQFIKLVLIRPKVIIDTEF